MWSVFTINPDHWPKPSVSRCRRAVQRLTRPSLQSFSPDLFCKARSSITRNWQAFQRLTSPSLQCLGSKTLIWLSEHSYCAIAAVPGCLSHNQDGSAGNPSDIDAPAVFPAIWLFESDAVLSKKDFFSASLFPRCFSWIADMIFGHNIFAGF